VVFCTLLLTTLAFQVFGTDAEIYYVLKMVHLEEMVRPVQMVPLVVWVKEARLDQVDRVVKVVTEEQVEKAGRGGNGGSIKVTG
ncbi:hypothetical protein U1Q18_050350, partial [Sarracenia purpurea var. burkii]